VTGSVYQSDPDQAPDAGFLPGELRHLVAGNRGRLLDLRRTPVLVTRVSPASGFFEVEIGAFEDAGAHWLVPLEDVTSYQFAAGGRVASRRPLAELRLTSYVASRDLAGLEAVFSAGYVSNPWAGDLVLAHLTVLAELGLGPLSARAIRDPAAFAGQWSRPRRAEHLLARTGFAQELWARAAGPVTIYRGIGLAGDGRRAAPASQLPVVSASLSHQVAESHFGSGRAIAGALYRQPLEPGRVFMTFLETAAMNRQYAEAEAVLLAGRGPFF